MSTCRRNRRSASTAAAYAGCIGLPDPGRGPQLHDGGLLEWSRREFAPAFDRLMERRPELRTFARQEQLFSRIIR